MIVIFLLSLRRYLHLSNINLADVVTREKDMSANIDYDLSTKKPMVPMDFAFVGIVCHTSCPLP